VSAKKHLIVGIDPGISTAYAALDLEGRRVKSEVLKEADADRIVREIAKIGIPSMIATDVSPAPFLASKISARFNVKLFVPKKSMREKAKKNMAGDMPSAHERDAYAAAIRCWREYANRMRQIDSMEGDRDMLKHLVLTGRPLSLAVLDLQGKK
jgi:uncharacterized protein